VTRVPPLALAALSNTETRSPRRKNKAGLYAEPMPRRSLPFAALSIMYVLSIPVGCCFLLLSVSARSVSPC
jgi:hypothetical protein